MRRHLLILVLVLLTAGSCARREAYRAIHLAHEYEENGHPDRALQSYEEALHASPDDAFVQALFHLKQFRPIRVASISADSIWQCDQDLHCVGLFHCSNQLHNHLVVLISIR